MNVPWRMTPSGCPSAYSGRCTAFTVCTATPDIYTHPRKQSSTRSHRWSHTACWVVPMGIVEFHYWNGLRKREKINMFPHRTVHKSQRSLSVPTATSDPVHILCTQVWASQGASSYTHAHCTGWIKEQRAGFSKDGENIPTQTAVAGEGPQSVLRVTPFLNTKEISQAFGCTEN